MNIKNEQTGQNETSMNARPGLSVRRNSLFGLVACIASVLTQANCAFDNSSRMVTIDRPSVRISPNGLDVNFCSETVCYLVPINSITTVQHSYLRSSTFPYHPVAHIELWRPRDEADHSEFVDAKSAKIEYADNSVLYKLGGR